MANPTEKANSRQKAAPPNAAPAPGSLKIFNAVIENDVGQPVLGEAVQKQLRHPKLKVPPKSKVGLQIATIASSYLNECLRETCTARSISADAEISEIMRVIENSDMLLVETSWVYQSKNWSQRIRKSTRTDNALITRLLSECRLRGIPTALWFTLDHTNLEMFAHLHGQFTHTFASDPAVMAALEGDGGPVTRLAPAVAPTLHNPYFEAHDGDQYRRKDFGIASDSYRELCSFDSNSPLPDIMTPALDHLFWLFETRFTMRNNNARLRKDFRRRFLGCMQDVDRSTILKNSGIYLSGLTNTGGAHGERSRNMLEAMASKALVMTNAEPFLDAVEPYLRRVGTADEMRTALNETINNPHLHRMMTHLAYREVMQNHTYADRLKTIADTLGLDEEKTAGEGDPMVTALVPTMRPELLPFVLNGWRQHNYANREMVVLLHSDTHMPQDVAHMVREDDNVRVVRVPESQSISTVMNVGIDEAQGDFWSRIDDDDYYGPNYYNDAMINRKFYDFDICGKSQWMIYFEAFKGVFAHKKDWAAHSGNTAIAGGTFLIRKTKDGSLRFDDRVQGFADVDFIGRAVDAGNTRIISSDPFNFLQIRRMDRKSHTWTADTSQIKRSEQISEGINLARIGI